MARRSLASMFLAVLVAGQAYTPPVAAAPAAHLHVYMHDEVTGPAPTSVLVVNGTKGYFGATNVIDNLLTEGNSSASPAVGRAQGFYMVASVATSPAALLVTMNVVLTSGPYAGSSVTVLGRDEISAPVRELSVVGGTGKFRMARGYVLWKTVTPAILDLDIFVYA